jgi:hypothetical protein
MQYQNRALEFQDLPHFPTVAGSLYEQRNATRAHAVREAASLHAADSIRAEI